MLAIILDLSKARLSSLVILTTAFGLLLAPVKNLSLWEALGTLLGTALIVASANAFNCLLEKDHDALMERTKNRVLVTGKVSPWVAFLIATGLFVISLTILALSANLLSNLLALLAFIIYVGIYTPLKRYSIGALFAGAIPGALPPMIGWVAASGSVDTGAWILFWILFFWQLPHFVAISLFRHPEYTRAGLKSYAASMSEPHAQLHMTLYTVALVSISFMPYFSGLAGWLYLAAAGVMGVIFTLFCVAGFFRIKDLNWSRIVFFGSLAYLPLVLGMWVLDHWIR